MFVGQEYKKYFSNLLNKSPLFLFTNWRFINFNTDVNEYMNPLNPIYYHIKTNLWNQ